MVVLAIILSRVSLGEVAGRAVEGSPLFLAAAMALALLSFVVAALRWRLVARCLGVVVPVGLAVRAQFVGMFGGQVLPSGIGVDVFRGWMISKHASGMPRVVVGLMADRLVALLAACLLALPALAGLLGPTAVPAAAGLLLGPVAVLASAGALFALLWGPSRKDDTVADPGAIGLAVTMGLSIHATVVMMAVLAAKAYGVDASLTLWLSVIPVSIIASAIPVSLNGWGVREAAIVVLAAPLGVPTAEALLVSVTLGVLTMLASLPGALVLLEGRGRDLA